MTDSEKIAELKRILSDHLKWYESVYDEDYAYDEAISHISHMSRGDALDILKILSQY